VTEIRHFVLVYDPAAGRLHVQECYDDGDVAMRRRFELERRREYADMEVVVLSARSVQTLYETHGRYFRTLPELLGRLRAALPAT
jgi:hypothetical protein